MRRSFPRIAAIAVIAILILCICASCFAAGEVIQRKGFKAGSLGFVSAGPVTGPGPKHYISVPVGVTKSATTYSGVFAVSRALTITKATISFQAKPASAAGTVTFALTNYDLSSTADDNLLSTATVDLEGSWLTSKNACDLTLTTTAADKVLAAGDYIYATVISDNADMTAGLGGVLTIEYTLQ